MSAAAAAAKNIPAILILNKNKTYGRTANGRLLYKAVPADPALPHVTVPYTIKPVFNKAYVNLYVLLTPWAEDNHTTEIAETIGPVTQPENTYTFELHCKGLWLPHPTAFKRPHIPPTFLLEDTNTPALAPPVFTIDGATTKDYDDAFSICPGSEPGTTAVTIYIANVPLMLAHMGGGLLINLVAGQRMSSVYLPDRTVPMMPARYSEGLCSLRADGTPRPCFTVTFDIRDGDGAILRHKFDIQTVAIAHNYVYGAEDLLASEHYKTLANTTRAVFSRAAFARDDATPTFNFMECPQTSSDVVAYWMLLMNWTAACESQTWKDQEKRLIYRAETEHAAKGSPQTPTPDPAPPLLLPREIYAAIRRRYGSYTVGEYTTAPTPHPTLGITAYTHITSPIRRMADTINIAMFMLATPHIYDKLASAVQMELRKAWWVFLIAREKYVAQMNAQMRDIKRVQQQCELLATATASAFADGSRRQYDAVLCNRVDDANEWEIYIPQLRLFTRAVVPEADMYDKVQCELFVIHDATTTRRFVRVGVIPRGV